MVRSCAGLAFAFLVFGRAAAAGPLPPASLYARTLHFRDDRSANVDLASFRGQTVALSMFYTDCSTVCPITIAKLREIERAFALRHLDLQIVVVSYDSARETPSRLARFRKVEKLSEERWHLLMGDETNVASLAGQIGLGSFMDLGEHILHTFRIVLLDENGVVTGTLDARHDQVRSLFEGMPAATR